MSNKTLEQLVTELDANIPRSAVKEREGNSGRMFSYLSADYVIDRMNKLFGNLNWSTSTLHVEAVYEGSIKDRYGKEKFHVSYIARVQVEAQHIDENGRVVRTSHVGTGYGDGSDSTNPGKAHELAAKEAESDALKRACKNFGQSMGLALYDKDQPNVVEDGDAGKSSSASTAPQLSSTQPSQAPAPSAPGSSRPKFERGDARPKANERDQLNKLIGTTSQIIIRQRKNTVEGLRSELKTKYGVESKEALSDVQAQEFLKELQATAQASA
jgi:hypothetical protein